MKLFLRTLLLVAVFSLTAAVGYSLVHWWKSSQTRDTPSATDTLAWLQKEYHLTDVDFLRVKAAHEAYQPQCLAMCQKIEDANARLCRLLEESPSFTSEVEAALKNVEATNAECRVAMLRHVYLVASLMPQETGRRYVREIAPCLLSGANSADEVLRGHSGSNP